MKSLCSSCLCLSVLGTFATHAQLEMLPEENPSHVFGGGLRPIKVTWRNIGDQTAELSVRFRLYQTTSVTATLLSEKPWKRVQVLPGQTVLEIAPVDFPEVRAETPFLVQWLAGTNQVLGRSEVLVYPTNLLKELKTLAGESPLGVFDPANQLKPWLKPLDIPHEDLVQDGTDHFSGKLTIFGPFESKAQMRAGLGKQIEALAAKGVAVVWIQPTHQRGAKLQPSFYTVPFGQGAVVMVQAELVADLSERPQSQLNLVHFARLAMNPEPVRFRHLTSQP